MPNPQSTAPPAPRTLGDLLRGLGEAALEALDATADRLEDAEAQIPQTWRRRLDPRKQGLSVPAMLRWRPARDRLAGRAASTPARPRPTGAMRQSRPRARRTSASSSTSSADPGEPPGDATPAPLRTAQLAGVVA